MRNKNPRQKRQSAHSTCSVEQAARDANVSRWTIRAWIKAGKLKAKRAHHSGSSPWRIQVSSLRELIG